MNLVALFRNNNSESHEETIKSNLKRRKKDEKSVGTSKEDVKLGGDIFKTKTWRVIFILQRGILEDISYRGRKRKMF